MVRSACEQFEEINKTGIIPQPVKYYDPFACHSSGNEAEPY